MVIVFSFLSGFYRKYFKKEDDDDTVLFEPEGLLSYRTMSYYTLYMLKIMTFHGKRLRFYLLIFKVHRDNNWMELWQLRFENMIGHYTAIRHFSFRLAVAAWCLMALVLFNVYSGNLFSYLGRPTAKKNIINHINKYHRSYRLNVIFNQFNFLIYSCAPTKPYREQLWRTGWEVPWSESYHWGQFGYGSTLYGCYVIIALAYAILKLIKFDFFIYLIYPSDRYWWGIESSWRFSEIKSGIAVQNERGPKQINVNFTVCISASTSTLNFLIFFLIVNEEKSLYILCLQPARWAPTS